MFAIRIQKNCLASLIAATIAVDLCGSTARAQNLYAVIEIQNNTKDVTISHQLRWGDGAWCDPVKLEPGGIWYHWYAYDFPNQNKSPTKEITFSTGIGRRRTTQTYSIGANRSPEKTKGGKKYEFKKSTDAEGEDYIELYSVPEETAEPPAKKAENRYREGVKSLEAKDYASAIAAFNEAMNDLPEKFDALVSRAQAYRGAKNYTKALADASAAIELNGKSAFVHNLRGLIYDDMNDYDKAFENFAKATSVQSDFAVAYFNKAHIHWLKGRKDDAIAEAKKALQSKPTPSIAALSSNIIGQVHFSKAQFDEADVAFSDAIAANSKLTIAYCNRAGARYSKGEYMAAISDANEALRQQPDLANAFRWRSQAEGRIGRIEAARQDYAKAIDLEPAQKARFSYVGFLFDRSEALEALASFKLGSTITPAKLRQLNELKGMEPTEDTRSEMPTNAKELVAAELLRRNSLQFEMVASANLILKAATMKPEQLDALGWKFWWAFGPVTAPNSRAISKDGLAGLRILARLDLPSGQQLHAIFALKYFPPANADSADEGRVGLLADADSFRMEVRLFDRGNPLEDYAHHSFATSGKGANMTLMPGFYLDGRTGKMNAKDAAVQSLGTSCITCHSSGPRLTAEKPSLADLQTQNLKQIDTFLDQLKHWGASKNLRRDIETIMKDKGPAGLLPLNDMLRANREQWVAIYPYYRERENTAAKNVIAQRDPPR